MSDCSQPDFWDTRYQSGATPWDFGGIPSALKGFLAKRGQGAKALIPGCGSGHELVAFAMADYDVTGLDFSPAAVEASRQKLGPVLSYRVLQADFFTAELPLASFDVIYERTFLCSLPPALRPAYARRVADLLKPGGRFVGFFYYEKTAPEEGPPWGLAWGESDELFAPYFLLTRDVPVSDSLPLFAGRERWQEQRRTAHRTAPAPATA